MSRTRSEDKYPSSVPGESNTPSASDDSEQTSYFAAASQGEMHGEVQPLAAEGAQGVLLPRAAMVLGKNVNISEANLPDGTNPDDSLLTQNIEIPAGYSVNVSEDLGWMEEDGRYVLELEYGRLTASADGRTLDYTLDRPLMNNEEPHQDEIGFDKFEEFELIGPDGAIVPAQVEIPIVDDVPVAIFTDMDGEFETGVKPGQTMTGLWDINFGADDASEPYRGFEVRVYFGDPNGDDYVSDRLALPQKGSFTILKDNMFYGVITFNADGTYSFMAGPVETKLYIGIGTQDADGDITEVRGASIALTISSTYEKPEVPDEYEFATIFFDEANLAEGTAHDLSALTRELPLPAGYTVETEYWEDLGGGKYELEVAGFKLSYDGKSLLCTMTEAAPHDEGVDTYADEFYIELKDANGNIVDALVPVIIKDDAPAVVFEGINGEDRADVTLGETYTGNWSVAFGADGASEPHGGFEVRVYINDPGGTAVVVDRLAPASDKGSLAVMYDNVYYGQLVFHTDGTYTFQSAQVEATLYIGIGTQDADGSESQTTGFTLNLSGGDEPPPPLEDVRFDQIVFDEAHLAAGTKPDVPGLLRELAMPQGLMVDTEGWTSLGNGKYEFVNGGVKLSYDASNYNLICTLVDAYEHGAQDALELDDLTITLVDGNGSKCTGYLPIKVLDDAPEVSFTGPDGDTESLVGLGSTYSGPWSVAFGADGPSDEYGGFEVRVYINEPGGSAVVVGQLAPHAGKGTLDVVYNDIYYGKLTFYAGMYTFEAAQEEAVLYIGIGTRDSDGDERQSSVLTLNLKDIDVPPPPLEDYRFDQVSFDEANLASGTAPDASAVTRALSVPEGFTVVTEGWVDLGSGKYEIVSGGVKLSYDSAAKTLNCSLDSAFTHVAGEDMLALDDIVFTLRNDEGATCNAYLPITVVDDAPEAHFTGQNGEGSAEVELGQSYTGTWNVAYGADGPYEDYPSIMVRVYINEPGGTALVQDELVPSAGLNELEVRHDGTLYGKLVFNTDGTYTFEAAQEEAHLYIDISTKDADGDIARTDGFELNLAGGDEPPPPLEDYRFETVTLDEANLASGTAPDTDATVKGIVIPDGFVVSTDGWTKAADGRYELLADGVKLTYDNQDNSLSCTLLAAQTHAADQDALVLEDIAITLVNDQGATCNAYVPVTVVDDAPEVHFSGPAGEDKAQMQPGQTYEGKYGVVFGADGPSEEHGGFEVRVYINEVSEAFMVSDRLAPASGKGQLSIIQNGIYYGTLTFNTDGSYSFQSGQTEATLYIGIGSQDADGDVVQTGGFTLNIASGDVPPLEEYRFETVVLDEANLANGTAPDASAVSKQLVLPKGYSVETDGWTSIGGGKFELSENGVKLTYDSNANTLVCSLQQALVHDEGSDSFEFEMPSFSLVDGDGNVCEAYVPVTVVDDIPEINFSDLDGKTEASIDSGATLTGHWNVNFGADGPGASGIVYLAIATEDAQNPLVQAINPASGSSINVIIDGVNYGTLTFKADGTYTFQAQPEAQGTIYIALGAPDGDGDIGYSENDNGFVLNIGQSEPPVYEDYYFGKVTFDEANLAAGSSPDASALEKALSLPAGFKVLTDDWDELADGRFELAGDGVVLRYDSASNSLVCVLTDALAHEGQGRDSLEFELPAFSLVDANGNERNAYVPVTVKDDAPEAAIYGPDGAVSGSVEFGDTYTGRWDLEFGADGPSDANGGFMVQVYAEGVANPFSQYVVPSLGASSVSVVIGGVYYGQLTFNTDGTFAFEARGDNDSAGTITIGIGSQDGDGDEARSNGMSLTLKPGSGGGEDVVFDRISFDEANLENGTAPDAASLSRLLELPAGYRVVTDGWTDLGDGRYQLEQNGLVLSYDGTSLVCSLASSFSHSGTGAGNLDFTLPAFSLVDGKGIVHDAYLPVSIKDDAPELSLSGLDNMPEVEIMVESSYTGNWSLRFGADGPEDEQGGFYLNVHVEGGDEIIPFYVDSAFEASTVELQIGGMYYGRMTFYPDGRFEFQASGEPGKLHFSISGSDGDGDVNLSENFVVTVKDGVVPPGETLVLGNLEFDEANLPNGTNPDAAALTQVIPLPPDCFLVTEGWTFRGDGIYELPASATDGYFRFLYDGQTLYCTLLQPNYHGGQDVASAGLSVIKLMDSEGKQYQALLPVFLKDDQPELTVSAPELTSDGIYAGTWDVNFGADGPTVFPGLRVTLEMPGNGFSQTFEFLPGHGPIAVFADNVFYGLLRFDNDGSYSFMPTDNCSGSVKMTVSAWDDDTSLVSQSHTMNFGGETPPIIVDLGRVVFEEANLENGTSPDPSALTKSMEVPAGCRLVTDGWTDLGDGVYELVSNGVKLVYDGQTLACNLLGALEHPGEGRDSLEFTMPPIRFVDAAGNLYEGHLPVTVMDDIPVASFAGPDGEAAGSVASGGQFVGSWGLEFGADGSSEEHGGFEVRIYIGEVSEAALVSDRLAVPAKPNLAVIHEGKYYGMLTFNADGTYSFQAAPDLNVTLYIGIGSMDADGDIGESQGFTLTVGQGSALPYLGMDVAFDEANLPEGTNPDSSLVSQSIGLPGEYRIDVTQDGWVRLEDGTYSMAGAQGRLIASADGSSLSYVLENAARHEGNGGYDVIRGIRLVDMNGDGVYLDARIAIADDRPEVSMDPLSSGTDPIEPGASVMGYMQADFGADGPNADSAYQLRATVNGQTGEFSLSMGKENAVDVIINGLLYGQIYLEYVEPEGMAYVFQSNPGMPAVESLNFAIGLTDGDGDTVFANDGEGITVYFEVDDPLPPIHLEFDEANMTGGTAEDSAAMSKSFELPSRYEVDTEGWTAMGGKFAIRGENGTLEYDPATNTVTYTLENALHHLVDGRDELAYNESISIKDTANGNVYELSIPVTVTDDAPEVSFACEDDLVRNGGSVEGQWQVAFGADGPDESGLWFRVDSPLVDDSFSREIEPGVVNSFDVVLGDRVFGKMTLNPDGTFLFQAAPGVSGELDFALSATDADYDTQSQQFGLTILPEGVDIPYLGYGVSFQEANLADGSDPNADALMRYFDLPAGFVVDVTDGWYDIGNGMLVKQGAKGYLACSEDGSQIGYRLDVAVSNNGNDYVEHTDGMGYDVIRNVKLIDANGNAIYMDAKAAIVDDAPVVDFGGDNSQSISRGEDFFGEWHGAFGADGPASSSLRSSMSLRATVDGKSAEFKIGIGPEDLAEIVIDGVTYGRLVLNADGTYGFYSNPSMPLTDSISFALALTDGDGDKVYSNAGDDFIVYIQGTAPAPSIVLDAFDEANLPQGTNPQPGALTRSFDLPEGYSLVLSDWTASGSGYVMQTEYGYLRYDPASSRISFTLTDPLAHSGEGNDAKALDIGRIRVQDNDGELTSIKVSTTVVDDAPEFGSSQGGSEILDAYHGFSADGSLDLQFGADGAGQGLTFPLTLEYAYSNGGSLFEGATTVDVPLNGAHAYFDTAMGRGVVYYDAGQGKVFYQYEALRGDRGDSEDLRLTVSDADGDAVSADMTMTLDGKPTFVLGLDEAGLPDGSGGLEGSAAMNSGHMASELVNGEATSIVWDTDGIESVKADGNLDGKYGNVTWKQAGNNLCGYADGELVLEIVPDFHKGAFTGEISAVMHRPFDHGGTNGTLSLNLGFSQVAENGSSTPGKVTVAIKDDVPFGNTGEGSTITLMDEVGHQTDAVYLVVDTTLSTRYMYSQIEAIRQLVENCRSTSPNVEFTLVPFGGGARASEVRLDSVSAEELLAKLTPDAAGRDFLKGNLTTGTDYTSALNTTMKAIQDDLSRPGSQTSSVYFMTDGVQGSNKDKFIDSWGAFRDTTPDLDVYALGVGSAFSKPTSSGMYPLIQITGDASNVAGIPNFDNVNNALIWLYEPKFEHNLLEGHGSADVTTITSVVLGYGPDAVTYELKYNGDVSGQKNTGHIQLENGATLVIYENGDYNVFNHDKLTHEYTDSIRLTLKDADGGLKTTDTMNLVVKDTAPEANDKISHYEPGYAETSLFGGFNSAANSKGEGWNSHNASYTSTLPAAMKEFPVDDVLRPFVDSKSICLAAGSMSASRVDEHIGTRLSFSHVLEDLGISGRYINDSAASQAAMTSKSFTSTGGEIAFNWSFSGGGYKGDADAAFWLLLDAHGNVVDSGKMVHFQGGIGIQYQSGVTHIQIPDSAAAQDYKLVIGSVEGGSANGARATLYVNTAVLTDDKYHFSGNVLTDPARDGSVDAIYNDTFIEGVVYGGQTYSFDAQGTIRISMESGLFVMDKSGAYSFKLYQGTDFTLVDEEVTYILSDGSHNRDSATLTLKGEAPFAYDNTATVEHGYAKVPELGMFEYQFKGNVMEDPSVDGQVDVKYDATRLETVSYGGETRYFSQGDQVQVFTNDKGTLVVDWEGNYYFSSATGQTGGVSEQFGYTLSQGAAGNSGNVTIMAHGPQVYDLVPEYTSAETKVELVNGSTGWKNIAGGLDNRFAYKVSGLPEFPEIIAEHQDSVYARNHGYAAINPVLSQIMGNTQGTFDDLLTMCGVEGPVFRPENPVGSFMSTTVKSSGGAIVFDWLMGVDQYADSREMDAAIWVLRDDSNRIISSGTLAQLRTGEHSGSVKASTGNVSVIPLPPTMEEKEYTLVLGTVQVGRDVGHVANFLVDAVLNVEQGFQYKGNVFEDSSLTGQKAVAADGSILGMVTYKGTEYMMDESGLITIKTTSGGTMYFMYDGTYAYVDAEGRDGSAVFEDFDFTVVDGENLYDTATLSLRGDQFRFEATDYDDVVDHSRYSTPDIINAGAGDDVVYGGRGNESIYGGEGNDTIFANAGNDRVYGGAGDDELHGGSGNDTIYGGSGNDLIFGDDGDDLIYGGSGNNTLWGGNGADSFAWKHQTDLTGKDVIMDFSVAEGDKLKFDQLLDLDVDPQSFFRSHFSNLSLDTRTDEFSFTYRDGAYTKDIELHLDSSSDAGYSALKEQFVSATDLMQQQEILAEFLSTLAS